MKIATLPGRTELFDLNKDPGEKDNAAADHPEIVAELEARLIAYAKQQKPSEWIRAQPQFLAHREGQFSIRILISTTPVCHTKSLCCRRTEIPICRTPSHQLTPFLGFRESTLSRYGGLVSKTHPL